MTEGTTSGGGTVPTVTDNLFSQGTISQDLVGVSFVPTTEANPDQNGELHFGAVDPRKFTGDITFVPITTTSPARTFWGIDQSITYVNLSCMLASFSNCSCATVYIWTGMDLIRLISLAPLQASLTQVCGCYFAGVLCFKLIKIVGTTLILLATDAFQTYQKATGATLDKATGLLTVSDANTLQSLFFKVGEVSAFVFFGLFPPSICHVSPSYQ